MSISRHIVALTVLSIGCSAYAQQSIHDESLQTLRGFRIGAQCLSFEESYQDLRREGFKAAPAAHTCSRMTGTFRTDQVLLEEDGKSELIELSFAPDSSLWRVKVSMTWEGIHRLSEKPSAEQIDASLVKRFGTPYTKSADGAVMRALRDGAHSVAYSWAVQVPADGPEGREVDGFGWTRWNEQLHGVVTQAHLRWFDDTSRQTLVVEMTNRWMLPLAIEAQRVAERQNQVRKAGADAAMLKKL